MFISTLCRGSGLDGLAAMRWKMPLGEGAAGTGVTPTSDTGVTLARPLLCLTRSQTLKLCQEAGVEVRRDLLMELCTVEYIS